MSTSDSFDNFFFTSNLTSYVCPGFSNARCPPPSACARDSRTGSTYCCDAKDAKKPKMGRVCWSLGSKCANDGTTKSCGDGDKVWCCLSDTEVCTGNRGQTNNCWNTGHDTLADIDRLALNETYSSLSSARPSLSSWTFDPATLIAATQTSSEPTTTNTSPSVSETSSTTSPTSSASSSISGGAIAGIVVGVVAVIALGVGFGVYVARKRNRQNKAMSPMIQEEPKPMYKDDAKVELSSFSQPRPQELSTDPPVAELDGSPAR